MADNTGIPFNLLTDEEVEELFNAGTLRTEVTDKPNDSIIDGGTVREGHSVPGAVVNPPSGPGKTGFERVGMGRGQANKKQEDLMIPFGVAQSLQHIADVATNVGELGFHGGLNLCDENGYPTCLSEQCGRCKKCISLGRSPKARVTVAGADLGVTIPWNEDIMQGVLRQRGGFRRGELALHYSDVPFFSSPRTGPLLFSNPSQRSGMVYNLEESLDDIIGKAMSSINSKGLDFIKSLTKIPQVSHQISDIEVRGDGSVVASYITPNRPVNVGTVGHVDMPCLWATLGTVISVSNAGVTVGGKLVYKFRALPAKHYFGGDYMGDSMLRNGRHGAVPIDSHYYIPLITVPKQPKAKREQWAQDALDTMIYNDYIGNSDRVAVGKLRQTVLHNAKRALKNKGLDKETPSLKDLFAKHGK